MQALLRNSRFYILAISVLLSAGIALFIQSTVTAQQLQTIRIEQTYAFVSLVYLYITLLIGPFFYTFANAFFREKAMHMRRAIGVGAFYFAFLHVIISFFGQLHGFAGFAFLGIDFLIPILIGLAALILLFLLTITSLDYAIKKMHFKNWKLLHRTVYIAGVLILAHTVMLGTHFGDLKNIIPQITFIALAFLLLLEAPRMDIVLKKYISLPKFGLSTVVTFALICISYILVFNPFATPSNSNVSFDIHAAHKQLAQVAAKQNQSQQFAVDITKLPGLDGDRNKRYTVSMTTDPVNPTPNQNVTIHFKVFDASSGNPVTYFKFIYAKKMHLIIVNSSLTYFSHIHPEQDNEGFFITTQFPANDTYHLYIEYQPFGGIEQQMAFTIPVGSTQTPTAIQSADANVTTKTFGNYEVTMNTNGTLSAADMSFGNQKISFTLKEAKTKKPITTLKPYLATFGHLTMINESTYDFIHVHPYSLVVPPPNANGGPTVDFLPIGIYGPFKPGIYRVFAEFSPNNNLFTADFTVKIN
ncbi:MAG TPA: ferric reductase-like transmembrane domain-containing protein [Candidatus Saccharimonadales bacterium]|nr:ferric reductase-like transmembrane domain-containing protein [Candidatus Saccharimonadales bacterium]